MPLNRAGLRRSLGLVLGVGLLLLLFRTIDDFPESWQRPIFFLGLGSANTLLYLLVTRRSSTTPGAGNAGQARLVAVLIHVLSAGLVLLACLFIALGLNPH
ncbi:hypothetical protein [Hymenobacter sp. CRA2]|uniref:hypothetical protein n=1 Tax=Hymenobacter sp. CRA2 TaxID=1955620 RepID=UPI00098F448F|nr:hypothetical protein [Hymenobacter sp. CRA2]OON69025.1 hypothetical protein B0919_09940 [Hymenobacter sp. CRA2]